MNIGFGQPLSRLAFHQRESFQTKMFGCEGKLRTKVSSNSTS